MSQATLLKSLERLFRAIGFFLVALSVLGVAITTYQFYSMTSQPGLAGAAARAMLTDTMPLPQFKVLVSTLSEAFLAFLVAAIFAMIRTKNSSDRARSDRLMHLTCAGYVLTGLIGFGSWVHWIFFKDQTFNFPEADFGFELLQRGSLVLMGLATLTPFIYAITVYALYTQLARLVNFESEVI